MSVQEILWYLGLWGAIGCVIFTFFVILVFRTGLVWTTRSKEDYHFKENISFKGRLLMRSFLHQRESVRRVLFTCLMI
ncbi:MAG: hypothetical protein ACFFC7_32955, partial [Candidatus Hermodarchaeota archaeon]